jgi:hypothetical protein
MTEERKYTLGPDIDLDSEQVLEPDGTRLTEARAQELAEQTLRAVRGRPSLTGPGQQSPRVSSRLPPDELRLPSNSLNEKASRFPSWRTARSAARPRCRVVWPWYAPASGPEREVMTRGGRRGWCTCPPRSTSRRRRAGRLAGRCQQRLHLFQLGDRGGDGHRTGQRRGRSQPTGDPPAATGAAGPC